MVKLIWIVFYSNDGGTTESLITAWDTEEKAEADAEFRRAMTSRGEYYVEEFEVFT